MKLRTILVVCLVALTLFLPSCKHGHKHAAPVGSMVWNHATHEKEKKKVLIISSIGGGAHTAASKAIKGYLGDNYQVASINIFADIIHPVDPFRYFSASYSSEHFYNDLLQQQSIFLVETFSFFGRVSFRHMQGTTDSLIEQFVEESKPDIIISVIPFINGSIYRVAQKSNIPFAIIPVDLDVRNYCNDLYSPDYKKFFFCLNFKDKSIRSNTKDIKVAEEQTRYIGFPVRPDFLAAQKDSAAIKQEFHIPADRKVAMVLMGSAGSGATLRYAKAFAQMKPKALKKPLHIILCLGRNEKLRKLIEELSFPPNISTSIIGFTDRISDLMRASDVLITKAGPASVCEALCIKTPIIIDKTQPILWWEKMNVDFVKEYGFGDELKRMKKLPKVLSKFIDEDNYCLTIKERMQKFVFPNVIDNVRLLVDEMGLLVENK